LLLYTFMMALYKSTLKWLVTIFAISSTTCTRNNSEDEPCIQCTKNSTFFKLVVFGFDHPVYACHSSPSHITKYALIVGVACTADDCDGFKDRKIDRVYNRDESYCPFQLTEQFSTHEMDQPLVVVDLKCNEPEGIILWIMNCCILIMFVSIAVLIYKLKWSKSNIGKPLLKKNVNVELEAFE